MIPKCTGSLCKGEGGADAIKLACCGFKLGVWFVVLNVCLSARHVTELLELLWR